ncbi:MAG: TolC family protein, partial [Rhodospirillaceae bacterium]
MKDYLREIGLPAIIAIAVTVQGTPAGADSLSELLPRILESHNLVKAAEADLERAEVDVDVTRGSWFPTVSVLGTVGHEKQKKPEGTNDTDFVSREFDLTIKQLLWDFGSVNSQIRSKKLSVEAAENSLELQRQNLMLDAISAYLNVRRAHQVLMFARESENNII